MEKLISLTLILLGFALLFAGLTYYLLTNIFKFSEEKFLKIIENPLVFIPIKKDGFVIGFSPLLFLILVLIWFLLR